MVVDCELWHQTACLLKEGTQLHAGTLQTKSVNYQDKGGMEFLYVNTGLTARENESHTVGRVHLSFQIQPQKASTGIKVLRVFLKSKYNELRQVSCDQLRHGQRTSPGPQHCTRQSLTDLI